MKKIIEMTKNVDFVNKTCECAEVKDHCHLTGKYRGPAHNTSDNNVTQKQSNLYHFYFII